MGSAVGGIKDRTKSWIAWKWRLDAANTRPDQRRAVHVRLEGGSDGTVALGKPRLPLKLAVALAFQG